MMMFTERTTVMTRTIWAALIGMLLAPAPARAQDVVVYYHTDAIGSVRATTDETGVLIDRYDFLPFGEAWLPPTAPDTRQFAGKERDAETGLDYFGARYHMSSIGRFTTVDPVMNVEAAMTEPQRWNRYAYALNNPLKFIDPDGRDPRLVGGAVGAAVYVGWNAYVNNQTGRPWLENWGIEASRGFLVGVTLGLAAPAIAGATARLSPVTTVPAAPSAYEVAAAGGKHSGFLLNYAQKSTRDLNRALSSFEMQIQTHLDKIRNPVKHIRDFDKLDPRQQKHLLEQKWPGDIKRLREQRDIVKRLLIERF